MTPEQATLVKESFSKLQPHAEMAAEIFYSRLFDVAPELRSMFKADMRGQGRKLMAMIGLAVASLDRLNDLVPVVEDLGRIHYGYGVKDEHYDLVGSALIHTLQRGLGAGFTPAVEEAWLAVYEVLSETMKSAAHKAAAE